MWMTPQRLLPASPRAVATVPKGCVYNTSGLSSTRHNSKKDEFYPAVLRFSSSPKKSLWQELAQIVREATRLSQELAQN